MTVPETLLFVSTLDGHLHAVSKSTGDIKWTLKDGELCPGAVGLQLGPRAWPRSGPVGPPAPGTLWSSCGGQTSLLAVPDPGPKCKHAAGWQRWVNTATLSRLRGVAADVYLSFSVSDPILQVPVYVAE